MSQPFLELFELEKPLMDFPDLIEHLKSVLPESETFQLGGVHRWSPEAFSFEFHDAESPSVLLNRSWENIYMIPLFKLGVYIGASGVEFNLRNPAYFMDILGTNISGEQRLRIDEIFRRFKDEMMRKLRASEEKIGALTLIHREDGFTIDDRKRRHLRSLKKSKDIFCRRVSGDTAEAVSEIVRNIEKSYEELEGWRIIDIRRYHYDGGKESIVLIEFCTPRYAGMAMEMNRKYNLILPCLGSVRSEKKKVRVNMFLPKFMFRPLFYSVPADVRKRYNDFPGIVTDIIRDTCLKYLER